MAHYLSNMLSTQDNFNPHVTFNLTHLYKREVLDITQDGAYMGIWQIFQAANIAKRPICSVHPCIGNPNVREDLHRTVYCIDGTYNQHSKLHLMWTLCKLILTAHHVILCHC